MRALAHIDPFAHGDPFARKPSDVELEPNADRHFLVLVLASAAALIVAMLAFVALVGAFMLATSPAHASEPSAAFACSGVPFLSDTAKKAFAEHAPSHAAKQLLIEHALRWDGAEMRRLCEAKVRGEDVALTCLDGRRDWDAIVAGVPDGQLALPRPELNEVLATFGETRRANPPHPVRAEPLHPHRCSRRHRPGGVIQWRPTSRTRST